MVSNWWGTPSEKWGMAEAENRGKVLLLTLIHCAV